MNKEFAEKWLNKLKEFWFNKDIESAIYLFTKQHFIKKHLLWNLIHHLMK